MYCRCMFPRRATAQACGARLRAWTGGALCRRSRGRAVADARGAPSPPPACTAAEERSLPYVDGVPETAPKQYAPEG